MNGEKDYKNGKWKLRFDVRPRLSCQPRRSCAAPREHLGSINGFLASNHRLSNIVFSAKAHCSCWYSKLLDRVFTSNSVYRVWHIVCNVEIYWHKGLQFSKHGSGQVFPMVPAAQGSLGSCVATLSCVSCRCSWVNWFRAHSVLMVLNQKRILFARLQQGVVRLVLESCLLLYSLLAGLKPTGHCWFIFFEHWFYVMSFL